MALSQEQLTIKKDSSPQMAPGSYPFTVLIFTVMVTGMSQGLLLPLLATILESAGVSSSMNGFNAAALYIGIFVTSFFIEKPVRRFGYKPVILFGLIILVVSTLSFPIWNHLWFWFFLRLLVGMGDSALHFATQLWITTEAPAKRRGKIISMYGFAYGTGFGIGPLGLNLLPLGLWVPFVTVVALFIIATMLVLRLPQQFPQRQEQEQNQVSNGYFRIWRWAWLALLTPFAYGYMEASLNGNFPVYALRMGITEGWVSLILSSFVVGSLLLQIPLGAWSDRFGRKRVLILAAVIGSIAFLFIPWAGTNVYIIFALFSLAGAMVGSFFSLGLAFATDILPKSVLPKANVLAAVLFSIGSIIGPNLGGAAIEYVSGGSMFFIIAGGLAFFVIMGLFFVPNQKKEGME